MSKSSSSSSGIGLCGAMFLLFLTLKLTGIEPVASWSWWWVTAPLWGSFLFFVVVLVSVISAGVAIEMNKDKKARERLEKRREDNFRA